MTSGLVGSGGGASARTSSCRDASAQDRLQVGGPHPRSHLVDPPGVPGADQQPTGAGGGHVRQPVLRTELLVLERLLVGLDGRVAGVAELRDRVGVTAQVGGQHPRVGQPVVGDPVAGEDALHQRRQEDDLPLQALGLVHRQQLDGLPVRRDGLLESRAGLQLGVQVGEQPGQGGVPVHVDVTGDRVEERPQLVASVGPVQLGGRHQLDLEPEGGHHPAAQVQHRLAGVPAQRLQLGGQLGEPLAGGGGVGQVARALHRVEQADHLGRVDVGDGTLQITQHVVRIAVGHQPAVDLGQLAGAPTRAAPGRGPRSASADRSAAGPGPGWR